MRSKHAPSNLFEFADYPRWFTALAVASRTGRYGYGFTCPLDELRRPSSARELGSASRDFILAIWWPKSHRHVGPEAECSE